jgi:pimeloyl-ACP methyl ester carboxylesterase
MRRRVFLGSLAALALAGVAPAASPGSPGFSSTRFSIELQGSGPDVILIPGLTASRSIWRGTVAAVPGYRYHLIQVAGFAGEPARGNARGPVVAPLAAEIGRYIAANRLQRPAIIGHSMGGTVAMMVAARQPTRVGRVMVIDMLPQPSGMVGSTRDGALGLAESFRGLTATPGGRALVSSLIGLFGNPNDSGVRSDPDVVARAMHDLAGTDLTRELPKIAAPLTVVYASPDPGTREARDAEFAAAYRAKRNARLIRIDNSGHMVMHDQPAKFRAAVRNFLTQ